MNRFVVALLGTALVIGLGGLVHADGDKDSEAIIDKAIKALGGAEKLAAVKAATWTTKGKINIGGNDADFSSRTTVQGLDRIRQEFEAEFAGNVIKGVTVLAGDKAWRSIGEMVSEMDKEGVANQKRAVYLQMIPTTLVALKGKEFKVEKAGQDKVDGKPARGLKITGPDGKDFTLYFDEESGLPVKQVARVMGLMGGEHTQESLMGNYKDFGGIKRATKVTATRDGEKFLDVEVGDFKVVKEVDPKTFAEPK